ncbi:hypothetical protein OIV83_002672 [Microbotryomycetes sp. JL201]|nr:hypothetical protein OIV83_002672 [Microbotryomycetes sp. JL201]
MDFLKAQIDSKKRALEAAAHSSELPSHKYIKAQDLDRIRASERDFAPLKARSSQPVDHSRSPSRPLTPAVHAAAATDDASNQSTPRSASPATTIAAQAVAAAHTEEQQQQQQHGDKFNISNDEAIRRLRHKGQPIRLFGETDRDRRLRLRALELIEERTEGQRNDFMRAMNAVGAGMTLEEVAKHGGGNTSTPAVSQNDKEAHVSAAKVDTTASKTDASKQVAAKQTNGSAEPNPKDQDVLVDLSLVKSNPHKVYPQIYHALKRVLREWEQSLADRPEAVRRSTQGKIAAATQQTSAEYLKPLFKSLRKRELEPDVLRNIAEITHYMQKREYLRANDAYLRLSIGNAPWPIGVTMVGIHERAGRERVSTSNIAHALNDETSRKYIQSLKRLLTFAQSVRPPEDLSQLMG